MQADFFQTLIVIAGIAVVIGVVGFFSAAIFVIFAGWSDQLDRPVNLVRRPCERQSEDGDPTLY